MPSFMVLSPVSAGRLFKSLAVFCKLMIVFVKLLNNSIFVVVGERLKPLLWRRSRRLFGVKRRVRERRFLRRGAMEWLDPKGISQFGKFLFEFEKRAAKGLAAGISLAGMVFFYPGVAYVSCNYIFCKTAASA